MKKIVLPAALIFVFISSVWGFTHIRFYTVENTSLFPLLYPGDVVLAIKTKSIQRGAIAIIDVPWAEQENKMIKICKAIPGDTYSTNDGTVIIVSNSERDAIERDTQYIPRKGQIINSDNHGTELVQDLWLKDQNNYRALRKQNWIHLKQRENHKVKNEYFLMSSIDFGRGLDSKTFGLVPKDNIHAVAKIIVWNNRNYKENRRFRLIGGV